jgi:ABC-type lipoprotein release transport system permease subunit
MGMMVALGMSRIRLFFIVIIETLLLTFAGTPVGIAVGIAVITFYNRKGLDLSSMGKDLMSSFGFETTIYPEFPYDKMIGIIIIVAATALLSAIVPSLKAVRLEPAEALKK